MNIAEYTIKNKTLSIIVILLTVAGGWSAYKNMARFEDPEFTIRVAQIYTQYPGGTPAEVASEVTEPLERALQQLPEADVIKSVSSTGVSEIQVEIKYEFSKTKSDLQIVWTKLRNKIKDAERSLPPGAGPPIVNDDFGDVYGLYYFLTGDGYSPAEMKEYAKDLQKEILQVEGVGKVSLIGELKEAVFVEISRENASAFGSSLAGVYNTLARQNSVVASGDIAIGGRRVAIDPSGAIDSVEKIGNLLVSESGGRTIRLKDIANISRQYRTPPDKLIRYNGKPAIGLGVSGLPGGNIVKTGRAVDEKIAESESRRPVGMELREYYHQGKVVDASIRNFAFNVVAALFIVTVTLLIFMGLRSAAVIGAILLLTISATLAVMNFTAIPMHRISLGALIIALGMMVDNAIVVAESILVGVQNGAKKREIARKIVSRVKWPLLGGTLVGIVAFAPIGFAPGSTAEYTGHLFWVILISLMFSWIFALTLTPLFCCWLFSESARAGGEKKQSRLSLRYKNLIRGVLRARWAVVGAVSGLFIISLWGFGFVKSGFFPVSTTPQLVVDYRLPQGADISRTEKDMREIEGFVSGLGGVEAVQTSIGGGGLRYMLIYSPESLDSAYGQILMRIDDYKKIDSLIPEIQSFIDNRFPDAQAKVWRFVLGPGGGSKIEAQFQGADPKMLRRLADKAKTIMSADGGALSIKDDWRQPVSVIRPVYSKTKGARAGVSREDLASALQTAFSGKTVGIYREGENLLPIVARAPANERFDAQDIKNIQALSSFTGKTVPITQITDGFKTVWRDGRLLRENRIWTIKAQSDPRPGELASDLLSRIRPAVEAIELPDGYTLEWKGEYGDSVESNENLASTIPLGILVMALIVFILFGQIRQPVVIWLVVPLALIGVAAGLLLTGTPLEFMGILGLLSLSGLLIKNAIVLVDQIDLEIRNGKSGEDAIVDSAADRARPVMLATLTTVLGVIPLFFDAFFQSMAVVLVFGLTFATLLTLIIVPALYAMLFKIKYGETGNAKT